MTNASQASGRPVLHGLYQQLMTRGIRSFLPSIQIDLVESAPQSTAQVVFRETAGGGLTFDWLGSRYVLSKQEEFSAHERRMLRSICRFLSTRYDLLFDREIAAQNISMFGGMTEDRYVSAFLDVGGFGHATAVDSPDRASAAIEVLRISALSSYEDKRISTGALLFGSLPDACHAPPPRPADALPYSSDLTAIRSFHRICDGLRTVALVDAEGRMVEVVDIQEWAQPYSAMELPVPAARRYRTHCQATLCGGHICLVLTPNGEIKIFGEGVQLFSFFDGRWRLTDAVSKYQRWEAAIGRKDLAGRLFSAGLNLAEYRRGGMFVVLDRPEDVDQLVSRVDLLETDQQERTGAKNRLNYLLRKASAMELSPAVLESIAEIDGSVVLDRDARVLAFGAILRHRPPLNEPVDNNEDLGEGSRTAAAIGASRFGNVLMISEGGQASFYRKGHCVWTI
jgi:hypothetical protein